jgi:hypothetical protein
MTVPSKRDDGLVRTPVPYDEGAERALLGCMLLTGDAVDAAVAICSHGVGLCTSDDLYVPLHQRLFTAMMTLHERGSPVDHSTVRSELQRTGLLEPGDAEAINALMYDAPPTANVGEHARVVVECAQARRVFGLGLELVEAGQTRDLDRAARLLADSGNTRTVGPQDATKRVLAGLLDRAAVAKLPRPSWLVTDYLPTGGFVTLFGKPGSFKSILALDLACSVASGTSWMGRAATQGPALYVMAEGVGGLERRVAAWESRRRVWLAGAPVWFYPRAVNLLDTEQSEALSYVAADLGCVLVVIDTLARCLTGGDENSSKDMSRFIASADRVRERSGACVLLVHHTPLDGGRLRGHSSLEAAIDTNLGCGWDGASVTLTVEKQKDDQQAPPLRLHPVVVGDSVVVEPGGGTGLKVSEVKVLQALRDIDTGNGATATDWLKGATAGLSKLVSEATFFRAKKELLEGGWSQETLTTRGAMHPRYEVSDLGREALDS